MDAKQFEADIQYLGSFLTECSFDNNIIDAVSQCELTHQLSVSISEQVPIDDPSKKAAYVRLILDGVYSLQDGSEASCKYHMVIHGKFMIDKSVPDEDFETKLWFNVSAAVYGIARSKMEVMSSMVLNHGKIELPMVNMYELLKAQFEKENKS